MISTEQRISEARHAQAESEQRLAAAQVAAAQVAAAQVAGEEKPSATSVKKNDPTESYLARTYVRPDRRDK